MKAKSLTRFATSFKKIAESIVTAISSFWAIILAFGLIIVWLIYGLWFGFSETLQTILHISLSIVTFVMVLLIQHTEYRDNLAMQIKLDELLKGVEGSRDAFINIQKQPDHTLGNLQENVVKHKKSTTKQAKT